MARKTKLVVIPTSDDKDRPNRDAGKAFKITEMSAVRAEKWATRALLAIADSGVDISPEVMRAGMGAMVAVGFRALLTTSFVDAEPLLDEMMSCVELLPDRTRQDVTRPLDDEDIEEISTLVKLRGEVVELHTGFSVAAYLSKLGAAVQAQATSDSSDTQTSPS